MQLRLIEDWKKSLLRSKVLRVLAVLAWLWSTIFAAYPTLLLDIWGALPVFLTDRINPVVAGFIPLLLIGITAAAKIYSIAKKKPDGE